MKRWYDWLEERGAGDSSAVEDTDMVAMLKRFKYLRDDVREHLKKKLPAYAVPSVIVPLIRFPLPTAKSIVPPCHTQSLHNLQPQVPGARRSSDKL
jgi:hypothetical protein